MIKVDERFIQAASDWYMDTDSALYDLANNGGMSDDKWDWARLSLELDYVLIAAKQVWVTSAPSEADEAFDEYETLRDFSKWVNDVILPSLN